MKTFFSCLLLTLGWSVVSAQAVSPVFKYTHPTKDELQKLATSGTPKGKIYLDYMVEVINQGLKDTTLKVSASDTLFIFSHLFLEEVYLKRENYQNSGYSESQKKMIPSVGHLDGWSFQWVFRIGTFTIVLIKEDCGNILNVPVIRIFNDPPTPTPQPTTTAAVVNNINIITNNVYNNFPQPMVNTTVEKRWYQKPWVVVGVGIGGITVTVGVGYLVYSLVKKRGIPEPEVPRVPGGGPPSP